MTISMQNTFVAGALLLGTGAWVSHAGAMTVTATLDGSSQALGMNVSVSFINPVDDAMSKNYAGFAGRLQLSLGSPALPFAGQPAEVGANDATFNAFCVDLWEDINWGQTSTWELASLANAPSDYYDSGTYSSAEQQMGITRAARIARLWNAHYGEVNTAEEAAAFQVAIWKLEYEAQDANLTTLYNGNLIIGDYGNNAVDAINTHLSDYIDSALGTGVNASLMGMVRPWLTSETIGTPLGVQDFVYQSIPGDKIVTIPVPLPAGMWAGLSGLGLLGLVKWNRNRRLSDEV